MNLNKAMIIGNLTRDPEIKTTATGQTVTSFDVATSLVWTDQSGQKQERAEFHHVVTWRKLADICGQYLHKGMKVYIEGRLQTSNWVGQDGVKRYKTDIVADNMIMLSRAGAQSSAPAEQAPTPEEQPAVSNEPVIDVEAPTENPTGSQEEENPSEEEIKVENIPF